MPRDDTELDPNERQQRDERLRAVGERIRQRRTHVGLSQERLAFRAKMSRDMVYRVERGRTSISVERLMSIAAALDVEAAELIRGIR